MRQTPRIVPLLVAAALPALAGARGASQPKPAPAPTAATPRPGAAASGGVASGADTRLALLEAMQAELRRSVERLKLGEYEAPYFLSYQLRDHRVEEVGGRFGAVFDDDARSDRKLFVDLRVGSYELDSSGGDEASMFFGPEGQTYFASKDGPLDDDVTALRNALWLVTDEKYKEALSSYFKKKSKRVYRNDDPDRAPSFSREEARTKVDPPRAYTFDRPRWRKEVRDVTALFRDHPGIFDSQMKVTADRQVRWFTSSEGSSIVTERTLYGLHVHAVARAVDGQLLENGRDWYGSSESELPGPEQLRREVTALIGELEALRVAPVIDPYTGPAILAPEATGVLFHEAVGHRLEGERQEDDKEGQTFKGQVGKRILPPFLTIVDDPTVARIGAMPLNGAYAFDEQGVPAQRTVLVKDGRLETYLLSRKPVKPFTLSNGHGRSQGGQPPVARMGNLFVLSSRAVKMDELKHMLIEEAKKQGKPYGLLIRDITGGNTNTMSYGYQAFKGTPRLVYRVDVETGKEELVRGVELVGTPLSSVNKVLATSDDAKVFNGFCGAESGYVPVSTVAPSALIAEIELQRVARANERSPILPAPWTELPREGAQSAERSQPAVAR